MATDGRVNDAGLALAEIETTTDRLCERAWRLLGEGPTNEFLELVEPAGGQLLSRIDRTRGRELDARGPGTSELMQR